MNVLITGAASGIGKAVMNYFLDNNHKVIAIDRSQIEAKNNLLAFTSDITNYESLNLIKEELIKEGIIIDVIIDIAGIHKMSSLVEGDFNNIKKLIDINLLYP